MSSSDILCFGKISSDFGISITPSLAVWLYAKYPKNEWYFDQEWSQSRDVLMHADLQVLPRLEKPKVPRGANHFLEVKELKESDIKKSAIFTDYEFAKKSLLEAGFKVVDNQEDSDFCLLVSHIKNFNPNSNLPRVSQFPFEGGFVKKDLLPLTVRTYCYRNNLAPEWWLPCFDLSTEFHLFIKEIFAREYGERNNNWIIKPANGSRGLGHYIAYSSSSIDSNAQDTSVEMFDDFHCSSEILESPRVIAAWEMISRICNYISFLPEIKSSDASRTINKDFVAQLIVPKPLTVYNRKFDLRVFVFVKSFVPFEAYVHDLFFARLANEDYDVHQLMEKEVVLTVTAYDEDPNVANRQQRLSREQLISQLSLEDETLNVDGMIDAMNAMLGDLFGSIAPSIGSWPACSAYYAVDVIFDAANPVKSGGLLGMGSNLSVSINHQDDKWIPCPKLIEVNFMGDWQGVSRLSSDIDAQQGNGHPQYYFHQWIEDMMTVLVPSHNDESINWVRENARLTRLFHCIG